VMSHRRSFYEAGVDLENTLFYFYFFSY